MDNEISWFSEAHINNLFSHFPLPLVILDGAGSIKLLNQLFSDIFDVSVLQTESVQAVLRRPDTNGHTLSLAKRDGTSVSLRARAFKVESFVVLILEMSGESIRFAELAELHLRLAELAKLHLRLDELEKLSSTDSLTGAWNRTHFDKVISTELNRSVRYKQPVSIIFFDIDYFKHVNDTYGHAIGDVVLRELVKVVWKNIRSSDMLFRWGGEEFVLIAPSTSYRVAAGLAETLRDKVENFSIEQVGHINISLGVAEHLTGESCDVWFQRADAALYQAKNSGRNRVIVDTHGSSDLWEAETGSAILHLTWHDSYECGEPTIDSEHRLLFDLSNTLIDASFNRTTHPEIFNDALEKLLAHVVKHFADEETILAAHHYVDLDVQKRAHVRLIERALQLHADVLAGGVTMGELVEFLASEVVARHMLQTDKEFFPLFAAKAGAAA